MSKCRHASWYCSTCATRHCDPSRGSSCGCPWTQTSLYYVSCQRQGCTQIRRVTRATRDMLWLCPAHVMPEEVTVKNVLEAKVRIAEKALAEAQAALAKETLNLERFPDIHDDAVKTACIEQGGVYANGMCGWSK